MGLSQKKHIVSSIEQEAILLPQSSARYKAYFFGPFHVTLDDQHLGEPTWRRNKARALLKWFLLNPGDLFSVEQLSTLLWPEATRKVAASNLHVTLHYLRRTLEPELAPGSASTFIRRNRHNYYWFELNNLWWTDIAEVQYLSTAAREAEASGNITIALDLYSQIITYHSRGFLPEDIYEDVFSTYRRQFDYSYTQLLEHLMELYRDAARFDDALSCALYLLSVDPYSESAIKTMADIHLRQGNITGALRRIDDYWHALKQDLGIDPGDEILALRKAILKTRRGNG